MKKNINNPPKIYMKESDADLKIGGIIPAIKPIIIT
tara:strand:- start:602 stop:709 length:108 start_codon:yes stop_codon:yes gene_type:complete